MKSDTFSMTGNRDASIPDGWRTVFEPNFNQVLQRRREFPRKLAPTSALVTEGERVRSKDPHIHIPLASWFLARISKLIPTDLKIVNWEDGFRVDLAFHEGGEVIGKLSVFSTLSEMRVMGRVRRSDLADKVRDHLAALLLEAPFDLDEVQHAVKFKNMEIIYGRDDERFFGQEARNVPIDPIVRWEKHLARIPNKQFRFSRLPNDSEESCPVSLYELSRYIARWIDDTVEDSAISFVRTAKADKKEVWLWRHQTAEDRSFYVLVSSIDSGPCRVGYHEAGSLTPTQAIELERLDAWSHLPSPG
jgi:hypothetical protein